eukprot:TRINITY_DN25622_c0_g1_i4.p1 TRINITY_DN25622_c0_g1~~TRINITY_DN25622_c0_g1_i4.p1  ORF type:complete len:850 (+),score=225.35 TRINITY_DN25622_c0_g1_i4:347-2551(+)
MCKEQLQEAGVQNRILCVGLGSSRGLGMRVRLLVLEAQASEGRSRAESEQPPCKQSGTAEAATDAENEGDIQVKGLPEVLPSSKAERLALLEHLLQEVCKAEPVTFEANSAEIAKQSDSTLSRLAHLLKAFPDMAVQCSGFAKGRPTENSSAKRSLSQARTESTKRALQQRGVSNKIVSFGFGSALGQGLGVSLNALLAAEAEGVGQNEFCLVPRLGPGPSDDASEAASLNELLKEVLARLSVFEPNEAKLQSMSPRVRMTAAVLKAFPGWIIRCEGHAKGTPAENNAAKRQLSLQRAEEYKSVLKEMGVTNPINCCALGCVQGLGMTVRMYAVERQREIEIPVTASMCLQDQEDLLNKLLAKALLANIDFIPNKPQVPASARGLIRHIAKLLRAFPSELVILCEAHARGIAEDDSDTKQKLTEVRAQGWTKLLKEAGAMNRFMCKGAGSSKELGPCVTMCVVRPDDMRFDPIDIPDQKDMSEEERWQLADSLLKEALQKDGPINFEANSYEVPASALPILKNLAQVISAFPDLAFCCEGHSKGQPGEDNDAKQRLSYLRAEAIKAAVRKAGAMNEIHCTGCGCEAGLGCRIRMFVSRSKEQQQVEQQIVELATRSVEERERLLEERLAEACQHGVKFKPNALELQLLSFITIGKAAKVLKAFPDMAVKCTGHAKGKPEDNNDAKVKLSEERAEAVCKALKAEGVKNEVVCEGFGCSSGMGICVQLQRLSEKKP